MTGDISRDLPLARAGGRTLHPQRRAAEGRDQTADERDRLADQREARADERDRLADQRDQELLATSAAARLHARLQTMPVIEQAKGILMNQSGCTAEQAFDMLRQASQRSNTPVRELAARIVASLHPPEHGKDHRSGSLQA